MIYVSNIIFQEGKTLFSDAECNNKFQVYVLYITLFRRRRDCENSLYCG